MALTASPNLANTNTNTSPHNPNPNLALQNTIDAHATRILRLSSPPEVCVDASLGPYVTSIFRQYLPSSFSLLNDVNELEQLMELLIEHCNMTRGVAMEALTNIYNAVRTGRIDDGFGGRGRSRTMSVGGLSFDGDGMAEELGSMLSSSLPQMTSYFPDSMLDSDLEPEFENSDENSSSSATCPDSCQKSPFKPTTLIPADLLGVLDDPSTPAITNRSRSRLFPADSNSLAADPGDIDSSSIIRKVSLDQTSSSPSPSTPPSPPITAKDLAASLFHPSRSRSNSTTSNAKDLAASLFHTSRSRSNSTTSPSHSSSGHSSIPSSTPPITSNPNLNYTNPLIQSSASLLLTLNTSLSPSAAYLASQLSNGDVNVAQFLIEKALNAPPVCRHMLNEGCYRSDCQFNHDVEGHTCLFWLRGRCVKGEKQCRFLHGFAESMLKECLNSAGAAKIMAPGAIETGNLVQHNSNCMMNMTSLRDQGLSNASAFGFVNRGNITANSNNMVFGSSLSKGLFYMNPLPTPHHANDNDNLSPTPPSSSPAANTSYHKTNTAPTMEKRQDDTTPTPTFTPKPTSTSITKPFSFASVASKGYSKSSFTKPTTPTSSNTKDHLSPSNTSTSHTNRPVTTPTSFVKIPQDLWNSSLQRNSSLFHIHDPLERYYEVSLSLKHHRRNVIDLHYQSLKSFQQVLNSGILDEKLREYGDEGVWIVTGSGHHIKEKSHQKKSQQGDGGVALGVLENAVLGWLRERGYCYTRGKDRNGFGGAVLVKVKGERL